MMKYSQIQTLSLAAQINKNQCLLDLNHLVVKEGCMETMPFFVNGESILDMDCVEHRTASEERRAPVKSMDSACVIADTTNTVFEILLIEFRFNYTNMKNLSRTELVGKVVGSTNALKNPANIHSQYLFIFNSSLKQQAIRRLRNMIPTIPNAYIATDINDLKASYF